MDFCKGRMFGRMRMPMMQLGDFYKGILHKKKIDQLIIDCKDGKIILQDS
jgi:hypothetical protein